jgi:preprotein translocase subunit SecB
MKTSPLQLEHYFVSDLHFAVNQAFDTTKAAVLSDEQFVADTALLRDENSPEKWQVTLRVKHQPIASANAPYSFTVEIVGFMHVLPTYVHDKERLVKTNGPTILYGIAREVIRNITSSGPHRGVLIPSVSFFEPLPAPVAPVAPAPAQTASEPTKA